jgi:calcineurin-like phosphoesterase
MDREGALARFLNAMPSRFEPASGNPRLNGVVVSADAATGRANRILRISYSAADLEHLAVERSATMQP